jgi:large subunit ribosomal protein L4
MSAQEVDPVSLIAFESLVVTPEAVKKLEERLA